MIVNIADTIVICNYVHNIYIILSPLRKKENVKIIQELINQAKELDKEIHFQRIRSNLSEHLKS